MLQPLHWPTPQRHRVKTRIIMLYKVIHQLVAVPITVLLPSDPRTRQAQPHVHMQTHVCPKRLLQILNIP